MYRTESEYKHWKLFNLFIRLIGVIFLVLGVIASIQAFRILLDTDSLLKLKGYNINETTLKYIIVVVPILVVICGLLLIVVPKYFPKRITSVKKVGGSD